ncbi:MAG: PAS domain-containing protein [Deltaproteobacteria bacterium]|nr:PAS domain-containing protein [Deltaproteobacteria bacterium]
MKISTFEGQIKKTRERLKTFRDRAQSSPEQKIAFFDEVLEEFSNALEELQSSEEELRQQNEELIQTRRIVEAEHQRYQELFDFTPDAYLVTDLKGIILEANRIAATLLSEAQDFLIGNPLLVYVATENHQTFLVRLGQLSGWGRSEDWEITLQPRKEKPFPASITITTMLNASGTVVGLRWLIRDITEQKQTQQALQMAHERLKSVLGNMADSYIALDFDWRFLEINPAAEEQIFNRPQEELIGKVFWDEYPQCIHTEFFRQNQIVKKEGRLVHFETRMAIPDKWFEAWAYSREGWLEIYLRDITERKRLEEMLLRSCDELETQVYKRKEELASAIEALGLEKEEGKQARKKILDQAKILDAFYRSTITPLVFLDKDFNFLRVNAAYAEACQRPESEFPGHNHFEFYPHEENEAIFRQVVKAKTPFQAIAKPFSFPDHPEWGVTYWDWTLTPLLDENGEVEYLVFALKDVTEKERAEEARRQNLELLRTVLKTLPVGVWILDKKGSVLQGNPASLLIWAGARYVGIDRYGEYKGWWLADGKPIGPEDWAGARAILKGETSIDEEVEIECFDGTHKIILNSAIPIRNSEQEITGAVVVNQDITERMEMEKWTRSTNALLELFAGKTERKEYLDAVVDLIHRWSNCQNVGIRIRDRQGNIPYEAHRGFSPDFEASENWLSLNGDQCACIRVIQENPDPQDLPLMTARGSFRCNDTVTYVSNLSPGEQARFRGVCVKSGFLSMAIIPIRYQGEMLGAIHLADEREEKISQKTVEFIETMTSLIGEAVNRFNLESELKRNFETQTGINTLLRLSLEEVTLDQFLEEALDLLISLPWPGSFSKGCIFLVEEDSEVLVMKAQRGFSDLHQKYCSSVPFGRCLCGQAVQKQALDFFGTCQGGHEIGEGSIETHAHYFIPIQFAGRTIGLINIYLVGDQYPRNLEKEGFLTAIADTMAGIIVRRRGEEELRESENRLRTLSAKLLTTQENERKKIAREVHDSLGSSLSAIKFKVEDVLQRIRLTPSVTISEPLEALVPIIQDTISETRRIQSDLRPPLLDDLGIIATFSWFCRRYQTIYSDILVDQAIGVREEEVPEPLKIVMFRITQEAMNNIGKYAGADRVQLDLRKNNRSIELIIRDNGKGFDPESLLSMESTKKGMGLSSMKERAELSGGSLAIDSQTGKGTVIKAVWPV